MNPLLPTLLGASKLLLATTVFAFVSALPHSWAAVLNILRLIA